MNLKQKRWLLLLIIFSFSICVTAQKKKNTPVKVDKPPPIKIIKSNKDYKPTVYYLAEVEINEKSETKITIKPDSIYGNPIDFLDITESLFYTLNKKKSPMEIASTFVVIKPHPLLKYEEVVNIINKLRKATDKKEQTPTIYNSSKSDVAIRPVSSDLISNIKVQISEDIFANIPKLPTKADLLKPLRPNPLFLIVTMDGNKQILLNNEGMGTINDLSQLKNRLKGIFKDRLENGVFREGTNEVETTIFIKAPLSATFFDIVRIAEALKDSGSTQIALQADDLQP